MAPQFQRSKSIFLAAIERAAPERAAYLDAECGDDADLRGQIEALLRSHEQAGSFLEAPVADPVATIDPSASREEDCTGAPVATPKEAVGDRIGPYKLLQKLGEGGMGAVFIAEQLSTGKRRALKVMQPSLLADAKLRDRFVQEAKIGAKIESNHVVEVIGAGIPRKAAT